MKKDPGPTFHKGQLVKATRPANMRHWDFSGWRRLTHEERQSWYAQHYEDVRAGRDLPYDSAGESRLAPTDNHVELVEGRIYQVLRGRVRAPCGYRTVAGSVELLCTHTGQRFYTRRYCLAHLD